MLCAFWYPLEGWRRPSPRRSELVAPARLESAGAYCCAAACDPLDRLARIVAPCTASAEQTAPRRLHHGPLARARARARDIRVRYGTSSAQMAHSRARMLRYQCVLYAAHPLAANALPRPRIPAGAQSKRLRSPTSYIPDSAAGREAMLELAQSANRRRYDLGLGRLPLSSPPRIRRRDRVVIELDPRSSEGPGPRAAAARQSSAVRDPDLFTADLSRANAQLYLSAERQRAPAAELVRQLKKGGRIGSHFVNMGRNAAEKR